MNILKILDSNKLQNYNSNKIKRTLKTYYILGLNIRISAEKTLFDARISTILYHKPTITDDKLSMLDGEITLIRNAEEIEIDAPIKKIGEVVTALGLFRNYKYKGYIIYTKGSSSVLVANPCCKKIWVFIGDMNIFTNLILTSLVLLLKTKGFFALHSALIKNDKNVFLLPGDSGTGKTTLAINSVLTRKGFSYMCDDICFLREEGNLIKVFGFCKSLRITLESFDMGRRKILNKYFSDNGSINLLQENLNAGYIPRVIIFPKISSSLGKSTIKDVPMIDSISRMVNFSPFLWAESRGILIRHLAVLKKLVLQSRCYELLANKELRDSPSKVYNLFRKHSVI